MRLLITKQNPDLKLYPAKSADLEFIFKSFISVRLHSDVLPMAMHYEFVCVSSHLALDWVLKYGPLHLRKSTFLCLTQKQADRLVEVGIKTMVVCEKEQLNMLNEHSTGGKVLLLNGSRSLNRWQKCLKSIARSYEELIVYDVTFVPHKLEQNNFNTILFYSPSGVEGFAFGGNVIDSACQVFTIGETTAQAVKLKFNRDAITSPIQEEKAFIQFVRNELSI